MAEKHPIECYRKSGVKELLLQALIAVISEYEEYTDDELEPLSIGKEILNARNLIRKFER